MSFMQKSVEKPLISCFNGTHFFASHPSGTWKQRSHKKRVVFMRVCEFFTPTAALFILRALLARVIFCSSGIFCQRAKGLRTELTHFTIDGNSSAPCSIFIPLSAQHALLAHLLSQPAL
jgi:hypothetical protein